MENIATKYIVHAPKHNISISKFDGMHTAQKAIQAVVKVIPRLAGVAAGRGGKNH